MFKPDFTCPALLFPAILSSISNTRLSLSSVCLPRTILLSILKLMQIWVPPRSLVATSRIAYLLSFPVATKIFQFATSRLSLLRYAFFQCMCSHIRISTDRYLLTVPRSVSPLVASFIAF